MEADQVLKWINAIGFPVCVSLALLWAFWKIGSTLLASHAEYLAKTSKAAETLAITAVENAKQQQVQSSELSRQTVEQMKQTEILSGLRQALPTVCKADCPDADNCENFKPKPKRT